MVRTYPIFCPDRHCSCTSTARRTWYKNDSESSGADVTMVSPEDVYTWLDERCGAESDRIIDMIGM
jgi:hypothetical protein